MESRSARLAAALIALCAALGVAAGFTAVFGRTGSVPLTAWIMVAYFTNLTGLLVLAVFGGIALRLPALAQPRLVATAVLATLLVGLVQRLLLYGLKTLRGGDLVGDILLHQALPVLVPLFWLVFAPKGRLGFRDLALFASYPLIYLGYTLVRGAYDARYPYPFLDVGKIGWGPVAAYAGAIAAAFLGVGWVLVLLDRRLARRRLASG
ncbi:Pr6Pr family membrane protein [Methylorubrum podarium]|uniref:Pr6Pr family membrane protein n=1 Tax=Methylorubrum podarium TaxID=200476 RepID=A0ABV1QNQ3_9HYPH